MERHPHLFWIPCVAHYIDLMLEDLGKFPWIKTIVEQGRSVCKFIYNHTWVLNLMKKYTNQKELSCSGVTTFATNFLMLQSLLNSKGSLRCKFVSEEMNLIIICKDNCKDLYSWSHFLWGFLLDTGH